MAADSNVKTDFQTILAVRGLVGRSATIVVQEGRFQGKRGVVVTGIVSGAGAAAPEVCVQLAEAKARIRLPLEAVREVTLAPAREPLVSRLVHKLGQFILAPRR